jgi:hypothetical protein
MNDDINHLKRKLHDEEQAHQATKRKLDDAKRAIDRAKSALGHFSPTTLEDARRTIDHAKNALSGFFA